MIDHYEMLFDRIMVDLRPKITLPDGLLVSVFRQNDLVYIQIVNPNGIDNITGKPIQWRGRKWLMSPWMTDGEIVQTIFLAVLTAMEHELRERFLYKGQAIFAPHYDIEKLVALRSQPDALKERTSLPRPHNSLGTANEDRGEGGRG